jgi:hypothetical protein
MWHILCITFLCQDKNELGYREILISADYQEDWRVMILLIRRIRRFPGLTDSKVLEDRVMAVDP